MACMACWVIFCPISRFQLFPPIPLFPLFRPFRLIYLPVPGSLGLSSNIGCCNSNTVYYYSLNIICSIRCGTHICVFWCAIIRFGLFLVIYQNVMYNNIITIPRFCAGWFCPLQIIGRHSSVAFSVWSTFPNLLSSISLPGHTLR